MKKHRLIFGKRKCNACIKRKAEYNKRGIPFTFFDLETVDGLVKAAELGIINKCEKELPVIIEGKNG